MSLVAFWVRPPDMTTESSNSMTAASGCPGVSLSSLTKGHPSGLRNDDPLSAGRHELPFQWVAAGVGSTHTSVTLCRRATPDSYPRETS